MTTLLPLDDNGNPIQFLTPKILAGSQKVNTTATTARSTAFASETKVIGIWATQDMFVRMGGSSITAANTDHFIPASQYFRLPTKGNLYIAAIRSSADGILYISELE